MNGDDWLDNLPENPSQAYDDMVLKAVNSGILYCNWEEVVSSIPGYDAIFYVCDDAYHLDLSDGTRYRPQVSATLAQKCADICGASLPTSKICDLSYLQAHVKLPAVLIPVSKLMATTTYSKRYNVELEKRRAGRTGLIRGVGKSWIISNKILTVHLAPNTACNYGYFDLNAPYTNSSGIRLWQQRSTRHNRLHQDFSQCLILMADYCKINGQNEKVSDVMTSPILSKLISDEGVLKITRQPGVI